MISETYIPLTNKQATLLDALPQAWKPNTAYSAGQQIVNSGKIYTWNTNGVSGATFLLTEVTDVTSDPQYAPYRGQLVTTDALPTGPAIKNGWSWVFASAGTFQTKAVEIGDVLVATQDNPTNITHFNILQGNSVPVAAVTPFAMFQGNLQATDALPTGAAYKNGHAWKFTSAGIFNTVTVEVGDVLIATQDNPTIIAHFVVVQSNTAASVPYAPFQTDLAHTAPLPAGPAIKNGFTWRFNSAGVFNGETVEVSDVLIAKIDNPTTIADFVFVQKNVKQMVGATSSVVGQSGTVPAAAAGDDLLMLRGDATYSLNIPAWMPATVYKAGFTVIESNKLYKKIATGPSGATFDLTEKALWNELTSSGTGKVNIVAWAVSTSYLANDLVRYSSGNVNYILSAKSSRTSETSFDFTEAQAWDFVSQQKIDVWNPSTYYPIGSKQIYDNSVLESIVDHISPNSGTGWNNNSEYSKFKKFNASTITNWNGNTPVEFGELKYQNFGIVDPIQVTLISNNQRTTGSSLDVTELNEWKIFAQHTYGVYENSVTYPKGFRVFYNGALYERNNNGTTLAGGDLTADVGSWNKLLDPSETVLKAWAPSVPVKQGEPVTRLLMGTVIATFVSKTTRTTGTSFDITEASNWNLISQNSVVPWAVATLVVDKLRVLINNTEYQANSNRDTLGVLDNTEIAFYTRLSAAESTPVIPEWSITSAYTVGSLVKRGVHLYQAITNNTGNDPALDIEGPIPEVADNWRMVTAPSKLPLYFDVLGPSRNGFRAYIANMNNPTIQVKSGRVAKYNYVSREFEIIAMSSDMTGSNIYVNPVSGVEDVASNIDVGQYWNGTTLVAVPATNWTIQRVYIRTDQLNGARIVRPISTFTTKDQAIAAAETMPNITAGATITLNNSFEIARIVTQIGFTNWNATPDKYQIIHMSYEGEPVVAQGGAAAPTVLSIYNVVGVRSNVPSPLTVGVKYLVGEDAVGIFAGQANKIATVATVGPDSFTYETPIAGQEVWSTQHRAKLVFDGLTWSVIGTSAYNVVKNILATPPVGYSVGNKVIVAATATTGVFIGNENTVATLVKTGSDVWEFATQTEGTQAYNEFNDTEYLWAEGAWKNVGSAESPAAAYQQLNLLGAVKNGLGAKPKATSNFDMVNGTLSTIATNGTRTTYTRTAEIDVQYYPVYADGSEGSIRSVVDLANYNPSAASTLAIPANSFAITRLYWNPTLNKTYLLYPQFVYQSRAEAIVALQDEQPVLSAALISPDCYLLSEIIMQAGFIVTNDSWKIIVHSNRFCEKGQISPSQFEVKKKIVTPTLVANAFTTHLDDNDPFVYVTVVAPTTANLPPIYEAGDSATFIMEGVTAVNTFTFNTGVGGKVRGVVGNIVIATAAYRTLKIWHVNATVGFDYIIA